MTKLKIDSLEKITRMLNSALPVIKVGIFSNGSTRSEDGGLTNPELGLIHEFGSFKRNIPERSFLRMPISLKLDSQIKKSGLLNKKTLEKALKSGGLLYIAKSIALMAENCVQDAFDSRGYGNWEETKNMNRKTNHQTLVETQQLRNSITSKVGE